MSRTKFLLYIFIITSTFSFSQSYEDVLRYNSFSQEGTSRFNAMGGAFGALGGDVSAISVNPASSSIFIDSEIAISLNYKNQRIKNLLNNSKSDSKNDFLSYGGLGAVLVYENRKSKLSVGYNLNMIGDFKNSFNLSGKNNTGIDSYFLYYADGIPSEDLLIYEDETTQSVYNYLGNNYGFADQQAFLGYQSFIINESDDGLNNYVSNSLYNELNQNLEVNRLGNHLKHSFNLGTSLNKNLFAGININFHETNFEETKYFQEYGYSNSSNVKRVLLKENLLALGNGVSFQLGTILKVRQLRLGFSYTTPTKLKIKEENSQYIETDITKNDDLITYEIDPNVINIYDEYQLTLPSKTLFSLAYIFSKRGLISLDYEITKFNNSKFDDKKDSYLNSLNYSIKNKLAGNSESIRIGGEYRIKNYNLRGGFFSYKGPDSNLDNRINGVSAGLGINFGYTDFDFGITKSNKYSQNRLFTRGLTNQYSIEDDTYSFYASFSIKL